MESSPFFGEAVIYFYRMPEFEMGGCVVGFGG